MSSKYYDQIVSQMPLGIERQVMSCLRFHVGGENRISRQALVEHIFGEAWEKDSRHDRMVRMAIAVLQREHPILSDSGAGGYWLAANKTEVEEYINEITSRARELEEKARLLREAAEREFGRQTQLVLF